MINKAVNDEKLPVYGDGKNIRDWIYVDDHCAAIDAIIRKGKPGEIYNVGSNNEKTNLEIVNTILESLDKPKKLITFVADRPGHDLRYAIDSSKSEKELEWNRTYTFENGIKETVDWYVNNQEWIDDIKSGKYKESYK